MKIQWVIMGSLVLLSAAPHADTLHLATEMKTGPYISSGLSGYGLQLGARDVLGIQAVYVYYTQIQARFMFFDEDEIQTYRLGGLFGLPHVPKVALQLEAGLAKYDGYRKSFIGESRSTSQQGVSTFIAWVYNASRHLDFRIGMDINYLNRKNTFLGSSLAPTYSTGMVVHF